MQPNELYEQLSNSFIERYGELIARHDLAKTSAETASAYSDSNWLTLAKSLHTGWDFTFDLLNRVLIPASSKSLQEYSSASKDLYCSGVKN